MLRAGPISLWTFASLILFGPVPALAAAPGDDVPGYSGVTYADLMKQVIPDLAPQEGNNWGGTKVRPLKDIDGKADDNDLSGGFSFGSIETLEVKEAGRTRILVLTGDGQGDGFAEILAAFDDSKPVPKLLDAVDIGGDRFTYFAEPKKMPLSADADLFVVDNSHDNSNQSYSAWTAGFLRNGKLTGALDLFAFSERFCAFEMTQTPKIETVPQHGAKFRTIVASVAKVAKLSNEDCDGVDGPPTPKPVNHLYRDVFYWDATKGRYVSKTDNLGRLAKEDENRF
jgi:hypothetical protein